MGVLCCYFRPKMFSPGDHVRYHSRTLGAHVFSLLASVEGTTVCLEIPLQPPPPPGDRHLATVSPPQPGDRRALTREFARGVKGTGSFCQGMHNKGGNSFLHRCNPTMSDIMLAPFECAVHGR